MMTMTISELAVEELAYHLGRSATLSATGDDRRAAESVLSWAILRSIGGDACCRAHAHDDLPSLEDVLVHPAAGHARRAARELALQLVAHFTSEQQFERASFYQDIASSIATT